MIFFYILFLILLFVCLFFNEAIKPSPHRCSAWHVLREEHLPLMTSVVEMFRVDSEVA